ncbi:MAG: hypothetical protein GC192_23030 [Bacteroidetes bacterium]|nr:hypothetical protein [Bacteroidota bacterium]
MTNTAYLSESIEAGRIAAAEAYYEERTLRPYEHFSITPGFQEYDVVCLHGRLPVVKPFTTEAYRFFSRKSKVAGIEADTLSEGSDRYKVTAWGGLEERELAEILYELLI